MHTVDGYSGLLLSFTFHFEEESKKIRKYLKNTKAQTKIHGNYNDRQRGISNYIMPKTSNI